MKKLVLLLLCVAFLLSGCSKPAPPSENETETEPETEVAETSETPPVETEPEITETDEPIAESGSEVLDAMRAAFDENYTYTMKMMYVALLEFGFSQDITEEQAMDGSFHFYTSQKSWSHFSDWENTNEGEYYYRYEGDEYICYARINGGETQRMPVSEGDRKSILATKKQLVGYDCLFPSYLADFEEKPDSGTEGTKEYSFSIPLTGLLNDNTNLTRYVVNALGMYESVYESNESAAIAANPSVYATLTVDADTMRPVEVHYDFSQLEPYVFSPKAQENAFALDPDGASLSMYYTFDFDLPASVEIPAEFLA